MIQFNGQVQKLLPFLWRSVKTTWADSTHVAYTAFRFFIITQGLVQWNKRTKFRLRVSSFHFKLNFIWSTLKYQVFKRSKYWSHSWVFINHLHRSHCLMKTKVDDAIIILPFYRKNLVSHSKFMFCCCCCCCFVLFFANFQVESDGCQISIHITSRCLGGSCIFKN